MLFGIQPFLSPVETATAQYLLDVYSSGPRYAFGLSRLISGYSGDIITVRRDTDGTTQNFGLVGDELDQAAIIDFVTQSGAFPAANGYVSEWFSQVNNVSIEDKGGLITELPKIVDAGSVITEGGKIATEWDGGDNLQDDFSGALGAGVTEFTQATVYNHTGPDNVERTVLVDGLNTNDFVRISETPAQSALFEVSRNASGNIVYNAGAADAYNGRVTSVLVTTPQGASSTTGGFANSIGYTNAGGFGDAPLNDIGRALYVGGTDGGGNTSSNSLAGTIQLIVAWVNDYNSDSANIRDFIDNNIL